MPDLSVEFCYKSISDASRLLFDSWRRFLPSHSIPVSGLDSGGVKQLPPLVKLLANSHNNLVEWVIRPVGLQWQFAFPTSGEKRERQAICPTGDLLTRWTLQYLPPVNCEMHRVLCWFLLQFTPLTCGGSRLDDTRKYNVPHRSAREHVTSSIHREQLWFFIRSENFTAPLNLYNITIHKKYDLYKRLNNSSTEMRKLRSQNDSNSLIGLSKYFVTSNAKTFIDDTYETNKNEIPALNTKTFSSAQLKWIKRPSGLLDMSKQETVINLTWVHTITRCDLSVVIIAFNRYSE